MEHHNTAEAPKEEVRYNIQINCVFYVFFTTMYVTFKWDKSGVRVIECHHMSKLYYSISMCEFMNGVTDVDYFT